MSEPTRSSSSMESELEFISLRDCYDEQLLTRFYNGLMKTNFPIPDELESLDKWTERLDPRLRSSLHPRSFIQDVVLGMIKGTEIEFHPASFGENTSLTYNAESLHPASLSPIDRHRDRDRKTDTRTISGGIVFVYYPESSCGLVTYFVVDARYRNQGILKILFQRSLLALERIARERGSVCQLILAETNATGVEDGVLPSRVRHKIMQRVGFAHVNCLYIQPPLEEGKEPCYDLLLIALLESQAIVQGEELSGGGEKKIKKQIYSLPASVLIKFLEEFAQAIHGYEVEKKHFTGLPYYKILMSQFHDVTSVSVHPDTPWPERISPSEISQRLEKVQRLERAMQESAEEEEEEEEQQRLLDELSGSEGFLIKKEKKERHPSVANG